MKNFKIRVVENIGSNSVSSFGEVGTVLKVKKGLLCDKEGYEWSNAGKGYKDVEEINQHMMSTFTNLTKFELVMDEEIKVGDYVKLKKKYKNKHSVSNVKDLKLEVRYISNESVLVYNKNLEGHNGATKYCATDEEKNHLWWIGKKWLKKIVSKKIESPREEKKIPKFKVGDKIKIREDLVANEMYGRNKFVKGMSKYLSCIGTITKVFKDTDYDYTIDLDSEYWEWTDEMFEDKEVFNFDKYDDEYIMTTNNQKEWDLFLKYLDSIGKTWFSGHAYTSNLISFQCEKYLLFTHGTWGILNEDSTEMYKILKASDFIFDFTQETIEESSNRTHYWFYNPFDKKVKKSNYCGILDEIREENVHKRRFKLGYAWLTEEEANECKYVLETIEDYRYDYTLGELDNLSTFKWYVDIETRIAKIITVSHISACGKILVESEEKAKELMSKITYEQLVKYYLKVRN